MMGQGFGNEMWKSAMTGVVLLVIGVLIIGVSLGRCSTSCQYRLRIERADGGAKQ